MVGKDIFLGAFITEMMTAGDALLAKVFNLLNLSKKLQYTVKSYYSLMC